MTYGKLVSMLTKFRDDLTAHRALYGQSLDRTIPKYPIRNREPLDSQQRELTRQLYVLDPYLSRFTKGRTMRHPSTGTMWDMYNSATGTDMALIKGPSMERAILELEGIIALVENESADKEADKEIDTPERRHVDLATKRILWQQPKTGWTRRIPLVPEAVELLR